MLSATVWARLGIDWSEVSAGDRLNAFIGVGIGAIGIGLGFLGYRLTEKQAQIAADQHELALEVLGKRTKLRVRMKRQHYTPAGQVYADWTVVQLFVNNFGNKGAEGFHWEVFIPESFGTIRFAKANGDSFSGSDVSFSPTEHYRKDEGHYAHKLHASSDVWITALRLGGPLQLPAEFSIFWRIRCEDGVVPPPEQLAEIQMKNLGDGTFAWWHKRVPTERTVPDLVLDEGP